LRDEETDQEAGGDEELVEEDEETGGGGERMGTALKYFSSRGIKCGDRMRDERTWAGRWRRRCHPT
jgi:hypothetical protein